MKNSSTSTKPGGRFSNTCLMTKTQWFNEMNIPLIRSMGYRLSNEVVGEKMGELGHKNKVKHRVVL